MKIVDIAGGAYRALTTPTGKCLWVDSEKGNDSLAQRGFMTVPFATLAAAKNAAASGDTIVVLPGTYTTTEQLARNGVNWHFMNGSVVGPGAGSPTSLFQVDSAMDFRVTGHCYFGNATEYVLNVSHSSASVFFEAWRIWAIDSAIKVSLASSVIVKADWISGDESSAVEVSGGTVSVFAREIGSNLLDGIRCTGGTLDVDAFQIRTIGGNGIRFSAGTARIRAFEVISTVAAAVEYTYGGTLTVQNARLVSQWNNAAGRAVYASGGSSGIKLHSCILISHANANDAINAASAFTVQFHGMCTANKSKGANISGLGLTTSPEGYNSHTGVT